MTEAPKSPVVAYLDGLELLISRRLDSDRKALHKCHDLQRMASKFGPDDTLELPVDLINHLLF
jgi:hypothetical protein